MVKLPRNAYVFPEEQIGAVIRSLNYKSSKLGNTYHGEISKDGKNRYSRLRSRISQILPENGANRDENYTLVLNWLEKRTLRTALSFVKNNTERIMQNDAEVKINQHINGAFREPGQDETEAITQEVSQDIGKLSINSAFALEHLGFMN